MRHVLLLLLLTALTAACQAEPRRNNTQPLPDPVSSYPPNPAVEGAAPSSPAAEPAAKPAADDVIWEHLGSWSGKGSVQTESFTGETGALRFKWETKGKPDGTFLLTLHSSISGRPLQVAVDQRGPGADVAYVNEDPRVFFAVIEATDIEWSFSVDEAVGTRVKRGR